MGRQQQQARRQQRILELCGAVVRSLTGDAELYLRGHGLYRGDRRMPLHAPHLRGDMARDDLVDRRGAVDGMALRLLHSDDVLHRSMCPGDAVQRLVFELLEQLRVESLVPAGRPGMARNLAGRFASWSRGFHHAGLTDSAFGILLYTLAQVCRARLNGSAVLEETEDLIEATRAGIVPLIGHDLAALKRHRDDQAAFATAALSIARTIHALMESESSESGPDRDVEDDGDPAAAFKFLLDFDETDDGAVAKVDAVRSEPVGDAVTGYRVFSKRYDREARAASLIRPALLRELREHLDELVRAQGVNGSRLARQLAALYACPQRDGWSFGEEDGHIDGRRLAQLVSAPAERRLFRRERHAPQADVLFTLLIDCSGSMKEHIEPVAVLIDLFVRALQTAGVNVEVLGFTTGAWNGGRVQRDWMAQGRPKRPGRLNELLYLVYKDADTDWRRARPGIAAMLKPDLFREGVDGEAVEWACARMAGRPESRRVLVVVSDGCPMDTATNLANDPFYLDNHLKAVVTRHERDGAVQVFGLGVGLDLSPYYRRSRVLDLSQGLNNRVLDDIVQLLREHRVR